MKRFIIYYLTFIITLSAIYVISSCNRKGCTNTDTGTIVIDPAPDILNAPWSLVSTNDDTTYGTGDTTLTGLATGDYTVTWGEVFGWVKPSNSAQTLAANQTVTFNGSYVEREGLDSTGTVTDIDGNVYQTVKIGNQWWIAENLKVTHYRNGDSIVLVTDGGTWKGLSTGAYCNFDNQESRAVTYGRLYNWYAVDDSRNIAPESWHVPTDAEWQTLIDFLGGYLVAGGRMKETGITHWLEPDGATNQSGFSALPGGWRDDFANFENSGSHAFFWSSTAQYISHAWIRYLYYYDSYIRRESFNKRFGFSVRCVRD
jgi:uncharacterized protein (TIGR02145 family)